MNNWKSSGNIWILVLLFAVIARFYGLNWDQGYHLHPDERFLTMVTEAVSFPSGLGNFFNTGISTFNPHNVGFSFYVYGTFPLLVVKIISSLLGFGNYYGILQVGRVLSGLLDFGVMITVYFISLRIFGQRTIAVLAAFFYSALVLPVQLAHFFAVDTYLTFFLTLAYLKLLPSGKSDPGLKASGPLISGLFFGLAFSSKYSAALFLPVVLLSLVIDFFRHRQVKRLLVNLLLFGASSAVIVRIFQPYLFAGLFSLNHRVLENLSTLKSFENPSGWFPPAVQWLAVPKIFFPAVNLFWWGMGPVLFLVSVFSLIITAPGLRRHPELIPAYVWVIGLFLYQAVGFAMTGRYFYPLLPLLAVISGYGLFRIFQKVPLSLFSLMILISLLHSVAFLSIYSRPHTRVQASNWIIGHIPPGSVITCEEWDDCLPLDRQSAYRIIQLPMFSPDTPAKWNRINQILSDTDYLVLSSNRVFGSVSSVPDLYPKTSDFYHRLFSGGTEFTLAAQFTSRPNLPVFGLKSCLIPPSVDYGRLASMVFDCSLPGLTFVDDYAEEAYTVYDHPQVFIFRRIQASLWP